jgi:ABC-type glycerol-3-phosphate transport system substrate-binding protein
MIGRVLRLPVCSALLLVVLVAGCSGALATPEPVTIVFAHSEDPTGSYEQWAQQFHDLYPHITVELRTYSQAPDPDVIVATQFDMGSYVQSGTVLDLATFIEQSETVDRADYYPAALDIFRSQGRQWALPFGIDMLMLFYNQEIFDRSGVAYPTIGWTWGDFLDRALDTTDRGADTFGFALQHEGDIAIYEPVIMIYQRGGGIFDSLDAPTRATFDEPLNIEAMEFYASLMYVHGVAPTPQEAQQLGRPYPWRSVFDGRFAMWSTMFSDRGGARWPMPWQMNWGVVPMPRDAAAGTLAVAEGLFITASTEHPNEAWLWVTFLSQQVPPFSMPARISLTQSAEFERQVGPAVADAARAAMSDAILVNPELLGFESALMAMAEAFAQIRSGEVPPDMALTAAQEKSGF